MKVNHRDPGYYGDPGEKALLPFILAIGPHPSDNGVIIEQ